MSNTDEWTADIAAHEHVEECTKQDEDLISTWTDYQLSPESPDSPMLATLGRYFWQTVHKCKAMNMLQASLLDHHPKHDDEDTRQIRNRVYHFLKQNRLEAIELIRQMTRFREPTPCTISASTSQESTVSRNRTALSFDAAFLGPQAAVFLSTLDQYAAASMRDSTTRVPLSPSVPFVQASCTGKTRTTLEAASIRPAVYFCLREESATEMAYPPSDGALRKFLTQPSTEEAARKRMAAFMIAIFRVCLEQMRSMTQHAGKSFAAEWQRHLRAETATTSTSPTQKTFVEKIIKCIESVELAYASHLDIDAQAPFECKELLGFIAERQTTTETVKFLVIVDEADALANRRVSNETKDAREESILDSFERVLRVYAAKALPIFVVYLSTNSKVERIAPPLSKMTSLRESTAYRLFPPITETVGFDLAAKSVIHDMINSPGGLTLEKIRSPELAVSFGRPMWHSLFNAKEVGESLTDSLQPVLEMAFAKMRHDNQGDDPVSETAISGPLIAHFAHTSQRWMLSLEMARANGPVISRALAESYMRMIFAIPMDRDRVLTFAPSEPVLAEVCAQIAILHARKLGNFDGQVGFDRSCGAKLLEIFLGRNFAAKGERGETVTRYLVTSAHEMVNASTSNFKEECKTQFVFHRPVRLLDWLRALVSDAAWEIIAKAQPIGPSNGMQCLEDAFKDVWVFVSHWAQAGQGGVVKMAHIPNFFFRGCAVQCPPGHAEIDSILPTVSAKDPHAKLEPSDFGVCSIQTKNRKTSSKLFPISATVVDPENISRQPRLMLVFELGGSRTPVAKVAEPRAQRRNAANEPPLFQVTLCGLRAFKLDADEIVVLKRVLDLDTLVHEHPRMDKDENRNLQNNLAAQFNVENLEHWGFSFGPKRCRTENASTATESDAQPSKRRRHSF